jgi:hypothetical protein
MEASTLLSLLSGGGVFCYFKRSAKIADSWPGQKLIGFLGKILICFAYLHRPSARCNPTRRWNKKVAKDIDLYLDYHLLSMVSF